MDVDQIYELSDNNTPGLRDHARRQHTRYDYDDDASSEASDSSYIFERRPSTPAAITENEEDQRPRKLLESYARARAIAVCPPDGRQSTRLRTARPSARF